MANITLTLLPGDYERLNALLGHIANLAPLSRDELEAYGPVALRNILGMMPPTEGARLRDLTAPEGGAFANPASHGTV